MHGSPMWPRTGGMKTIESIIHAALLTYTLFDPPPIIHQRLGWRVSALRLQISTIGSRVPGPRTALRQSFHPSLPGWSAHAQIHKHPCAIHTDTHVWSRPQIRSSFYPHTWTYTHSMPQVGMLVALHSLAGALTAMASGRAQGFDIRLIDEVRTNNRVFVLFSLLTSP